ncbi:hypothetical protein RGQ29_008856 [Quercus rubra]|uniref:Uncharacterized protein n=1 Tax=Quercus rubra TaxID=3512 RepID=A0AAN7E1D7_QUERU|nr:hypothetical protein RGQ29_008856 [Quercus rubra]
MASKASLPVSPSSFVVLFTIPSQHNIYYQFLPMSETNNYLSSFDGHFCDVDNCIIKTSLKLHTFDDDCAYKFFKWLDTSICCMRGAAIAPIIIAKFRRLEHTVEVANEEVKQAHALTNATMKRE